MKGLRIAITGGIAEGKSTVLGYIQELGHRVASADQIAREVFLIPEVQRRISSLANLPSPVDAGHLREQIAAEPELRRALNAIMHPEIVRRMDESGATFYEIPLVIETCRYLHFDEIWVVTCGKDVQRERLRQRYGDNVQVEQIVATQIPTNAKLAFADRIIRTNAPTETVRELVSEAIVSIFRY